MVKNNIRNLQLNKAVAMNGEVEKSCTLVIVVVKMQHFCCILAG